MGWTLSHILIFLGVFVALFLLVGLCVLLRPLGKCIFCGKSVWWWNCYDSEHLDDIVTHAHQRCMEEKWESITFHFEAILQNRLLFYKNLSASCKVGECLVCFCHSMHIVLLFHCCTFIIWNIKYFLWQSFLHWFSLCWTCSINNPF